MTTCLHKIISDEASRRAATDAGTRMHEMLQRVTIGDGVMRGDAGLIQKLKSDTDIAFYFHPDSKTEVPVAGTIDSIFISRRIDRMRIDHTTKQIHILDYKTDIDTTTHRQKYIAQLKEYASLMQMIYPEYSVTAAILWTHNWQLEKILK